MPDERLRNWASRTLSMHRRTFSSSVKSRALLTSSSQWECCIIWSTPSWDGEPCCPDCGPEDSCTWAFTANSRAKRVVKSREIIATCGYGSTPEDIRRFRQDLAVRNPGGVLQRLSQFSDFYSTSECRDLLFHVQEHRLTLGQIESFLADFGLQFIGFELEREVLHRYRVRFPDDPSATNLRNWACFEADNPDTFAGMYQFWIQKPLRADK